MARILVVDDDLGVGSTVEAMLSSSGHEVTFQSQSKEAITALSAEVFDLVISDVFMPDLDGIELVLEVRKKSPQTKILLMTGGAQYFLPGSEELRNITSTAELVGANLTIGKPFRKQQLMDAVSELIL